MAKKSMDVLGFGITAVDDLVELSGFPEAGGKEQALAIRRQGGGLCETALVAAARLGLDCAYCGVLGVNALSEFTRSVFQNEGISLDHVRTVPDAEPCHAIVLVDSSTGERTILYRDQGMLALTPDEIPEDLIARTRVLLVDSLGPKGVVHACEIARRHAVQTVGDFEDLSSAEVREAASLTDHLIVPLRAAAKYTGISNPEGALRKLAGIERACTAVTDGSRGCWFVTGTDTVQHQPAFPVKVVDTTGCGDVFHGAYAAALVWGHHIVESVRFASAASALKAQSPGGQQGIPNREAVVKFLADFA